MCSCTRRRGLGCGVRNHQLVAILSKEAFAKSIIADNLHGPECDVLDPNEQGGILRFVADTTGANEVPEEGVLGEVAEIDRLGRKKEQAPEVRSRGITALITTGHCEDFNALAQRLFCVIPKLARFFRKTLPIHGPRIHNAMRRVNRAAAALRTFSSRVRLAWIRSSLAGSSKCELLGHARPPRRWGFEYIRDMRSVRNPLLTVVIGVLILGRVVAADTAADPGELTRARYQTNTIGMSVLTAWAGVNLVGGGILALTSDDSFSQSFHGANAGWNIVNLGLGLPGLLGSLDTPDLDLPSTIREQQTIESVLLLNAGLDVAYMVAGGGMLLESRLASLGAGSFGLSEAEARGIGIALILQGGFLFAFDLVMFFLHQANRNEFLDRLGGGL